MNKTIIAAALAASVATPAFAAGTIGSYGAAGPYAYSGPHAWTSVNYAPRGYLRAAPQGYVAGQPYAFAGEPYAAVEPGIGTGIVVENGRIIGADPDPNVRLQLRREAQLSDEQNFGVPYGF